MRVGEGERESERERERERIKKGSQAILLFYSIMA